MKRTREITDVRTISIEELAEKSEIRGRNARKKTVIKLISFRVKNLICLIRQGLRPDLGYCGQGSEILVTLRGGTFFTIRSTFLTEG
jgi:hypothetical protein